MDNSLNKNKSKEEPINLGTNFNEALERLLRVKVDKKSNLYIK